MNYDKIRNSVNPRVEYLIQATIQGIIDGAAAAAPPAPAAAAAAAPTTKSPAKAPAKPSSSSSVEEAPLTLFGGDDGW